MTCRQIQSRFVELLDGDLRPQQAARVEAHVAGCPSCRDALKALRAFDGLCREHLPAPAPEYTTEELLARLEGVEALEALQPVLPPLPVGQTAPRLATAALLLAVAGSLHQSAKAQGSAVEQQQQAIYANLGRLEAELLEAGLPPRQYDQQG